MYRWTEAARYRPMPVQYAPAQWRPVTRRKPCPICGKPDWCSVTEDLAAACCMRVPDEAVATRDLGHGIGYIHRLSELTVPRPPNGSSPPVRRNPAWYDYEAILDRWRSQTPALALRTLAAGLGVSVNSLKRLGACYCPSREAWAFPMHDDRRRIIGVRFRREDGGKFALTGSRTGAFIPAGLDSRSPLLICEGPTDTAAALTLGFQALGRPSCSGATAIICDMLEVGRRRDVIIVADADGPGCHGAIHLADRILGLCRSVKTIVPPHNDIRDWVRAGATTSDVQARIDRTEYHRHGLD